MNKILVFVGGVITGVAAGVLAMKASSDKAGEPGKDAGAADDDAESAPAEESEQGTSPEDPSEEEEEEE